MFKFILPLFYETPGNVGAPSGAGTTTTDSGRGKSHSVEDDVKFLREGREEGSNEEEGNEEEEVEGEEEAEEHEGEEEEEESKEGEEEEEEEHKEGEEEEQPEEENEEEEAGALVTAKDITTKFPEFFKKFPQVRGIIHRERQYAEIFADPKIAQQASVKSDTFDRVENDIFMEGNMKPLLETVKKSPEAFTKVCKNLLNTLKDVDEATYYKVASVPIKKAIRAAIAEATRKGDKNLLYGAQHLHQFVFDNLDIDAKTDFEVEGKAEKGEAEKKYEQKLAELDIRDHSNFKTAVDTEFLTKIEKEFFNGLDPDSILTDWTKKNMFKDFIQQLNTQVSSDPRHGKSIELLWRQAKSSGYTSDSKSRIVNTALARAKQILPELRAALRAEALGERRRVVKAKGNEGKKVFKGTNVVNKNSNERRTNNNNGKNPRKISEMSELDVIRS